MTSLTPSPHWEFSRIILKLNVKMAPEGSYVNGHWRILISNNKPNFTHIWWPMPSKVQQKLTTIIQFSNVFHNSLVSSFSISEGFPSCKHCSPKSFIITSSLALFGSLNFYAIFWPKLVTKRKLKNIWGTILYLLKSPKLSKAMSLTRPFIACCGPLSFLPCLPLNGNLRYHRLLRWTVLESLTIIYFSNFHCFVLQTHHFSSNVRYSNISDNKCAWTIDGIYWARYSWIYGSDFITSKPPQIWKS